MNRVILLNVVVSAPRVSALQVLLVVKLVSMIISYDSHEKYRNYSIRTLQLWYM